MANTKVQSEQIEDGSITADKLADGTIVAAELADNAVVTAAINADAVTGAKIADNAIDSEHYTDGSIDTAHIADSQITVGKMAANSVDSDQYVDGSIDTVHIADLQVTTAKIANGNISTAKIADNAVTSAKIDTNIDIAGTFDVTGATTLDSTLQVDGAITSSAGATITVADNSDNLTLTSTDADANVAPNLRMYRNSSSPADSDQLGKIQYEGRNDNSQDVIYGEIGSQIKDASDGTEDGRVFINTMLNGGLASRVNIMPTELVINDESNDLDFRVESNGNANMLFVDGGNDRVGIGTTSPSQILEVYNAATDNQAYLVLKNNRARNAAVNFVTTAANWYVGAGIGTDTDVFQIYDGDVGTRLLIDSSGNVGIRNSSPTSFNSLGGNSLVIGDGTQTNNLFLYSATTGGTVGYGHIAFADSNANGSSAQYAGLIQYYHGNNSMAFYTGSTKRMTINSTGQLLVNTTSNNSDSYKMVVDGGGGSKGIDVRGISYSANNGAFRSVPSGNTTYLFAAMLNSNNSTVGSILVSSNATVYNTSSDYRLKENITPLENGLDRLNQLKPVNFNWIEGGKEEEGFIAHEVEEVFPYAVTGEKDAVKDDGTVSPQTMDYGRITPLLVKAIQEQQTIIEAQTTSINDLKTRIEALES
jgi:hypothetical protein